jgi:hypothetical protein
LRQESRRTSAAATGIAVSASRHADMIHLGIASDSFRHAAASLPAA